MVLPFPDDGLKFLSQSVGNNIVWKERFIKPYAQVIDAVEIPTDRQPIREMNEQKPIDQFLTLSVSIEVALLHGDGTDLRFAGVGVILECSSKGNWVGYLVPHIFFLVV